MAGETAPTAAPVPNPNATNLADEDLENAPEGVAGGFTEEQAGIAPDVVSPTAVLPMQPVANQTWTDTDKGITP